MLTATYRLHANRAGANTQRHCERICNRSLTPTDDDADHFLHQYAGPREVEKEVEEDVGPFERLDHVQSNQRHSKALEETISTRPVQTDISVHSANFSHCLLSNSQHEHSGPFKGGAALSRPPLQRISPACQTISRVLHLLVSQNSHNQTPTSFKRPASTILPTIHTLPRLQQSPVTSPGQPRTPPRHNKPLHALPAHPPLRPAPNRPV